MSLLIEIPIRNKVCSKGQEPLQPNMEYYSILVEGENGFARQDYCLACWEKEKQGGSTKMISHWKAHVPNKTKNGDEDEASKLDKQERALHFLKKSLQENSVEAEREAFVLALYLARQRILYLRQEIKQDGQRIQLYEHADTEEMIPVKRVDLSAQHLKKTQESLAEKLK